jgi:hypothetical protein
MAWSLILFSSRAVQPRPAFILHLLPEAGEPSAATLIDGLTQIRSDQMSIFGKIKDAIFGRKAKAQTAPQQRPAQPTGQQPPAMPQMNPAAAPAAPAQDVDVDAILAEAAAGKNEKLNYKTSIVDLMKLLDLDSSLANRKELADELGYAGAKDGSAEMNIWLHKAVMKKLEENGGKVSAELKD